MSPRRFSLPEACPCGARGTVTFEEGDILHPGDLHPKLKVVEVDGPFRLDAEGNVHCLNCEGAARRAGT